MSAPTIDDVVDSVLARVQSLGLTLGAAPVTVAKGKQPRQQAGDTPNTQVTVHAAQGPHDADRFDSLSDLYTYRAGVTVWTPGNQANAPDPLFAALGDQIIAALNAEPAALAGLDGLLEVKARTGDYLDRAAFKGGWDVQQVAVEVQIVRAR